MTTLTITCPDCSGSGYDDDDPTDASVCNSCNGYGTTSAKENTMSAAQNWIRAREDAGAIIPNTTQTAILHGDRVEFDDGTTVQECPWNPALPLDVYLYALDYEPVAS